MSLSSCLVLWPDSQGDNAVYWDCASCQLDSFGTGSFVLAVVPILSVWNRTVPLKLCCLAFGQDLLGAGCSRIMLFQPSAQPLWNWTVTVELAGIKPAGFLSYLSYLSCLSYIKLFELFRLSGALV